MLSEDLEKENVLEDLGIDDLAVINKAKELLSSSPVLSSMDETNSTKNWYLQNVEVQTKLENLKSNVDMIMWRKHYAALRLEGDELENDEDLMGNFRSRDDRIAVMISHNNTLKDLRLTEKRLECISNYLKGLIWGLRNSCQVLTMRH